MKETYTSVLAGIFAAAYEDMKNGEDQDVCLAAAAEAYAEVNLWEK